MNTRLIGIRALPARMKGGSIHTWNINTSLPIMFMDSSNTVLLTPTRPKPSGMPMAMNMRVSGITRLPMGGER